MLKGAWLQAGVIVFGLAFTGRADITYDVSRTIGTGSLTGTIETDGSLGVLTAADIQDWNLVLFDGINTFTLTGPSSGNNSVVFVQGGDVSASATQLLFDFSGSDNGVFLFQQGLFSGNHYYCDATQVGDCFAGESVVPTSVFTKYELASPSGEVVIGTVQETSQVPEPTSVILLASVLLGVALARKRIAPSTRTNS